MPIEIRILSGARAGQAKRFEQAVIVVGRHASTDLRFDPQQDLDVSGRHAEIRGTEGQYVIHDFGSTNGTFVNGKKVDGTVELKDGDKITFGAKGPEAKIAIYHAGAEPKPPKTAERGAGGGGRGGNTEQRIAIAVNKETAGLKRAMIVGLVLLVVGAGGAVYYGRLQDSQRTEEFKQLIADNERMRVMLQSSMRGSGDTSLVNESQRKIAALQQRLAAATTDAERDKIKAEIQENERQLRRMVAMDLPAIHKQNSGAVAIMISEISGKSSAGSGFAITPQGLMITNRHNVKDLESGAVASRIAVKFTGTRDWLPAKVVKVSDDPDEDLALIQVERAGPFPVVAGVSSNASDASEGMSVVTIGYPLGYDTPQEGAGNDFLAKSTLNPGTVSKKTSTVLQIDSYATHGSSGSPVFSTRGFVVGIIYGGQRESAGKIVYAVPPERIAGFIPAEHKAIIRD